MKLTAIALASALAFSSTCAFGQTVRHESNVGTYQDAAPSVVLHPKYGDPNGNFNGGYGNRDVWGHWGTYYGPMIPSVAGGR